MATVNITNAAQSEFNKLPKGIQFRVQAVFVRLEKWPNVSGCKPLRRERSGQFRIRTGDYRVVFTASNEVVTVVKIGDRRDVYD